jgi:energy-converting hydrogenase Eha subunit A
MVGVYSAPLLVARSKGRAVVDSEWVIALGVAALVAAVLGIAVMIVLSVCQFCGTLGSYSACYWTMLTWLWGYYC